MAYTFRIHEPKKPTDPAPVAAATMSGWTQTSHIAGNLLGNIKLSLATNKMGTSIPSLFARILLFDVAFQTLHGKDFLDMTLSNPDTKLVSEALDLMEFLYQHGRDPKLVIRRWNAQQQIQGLRSSGFPQHQLLATVIEDEIVLRPELGDIYLFFWKDSTPTSLQEQEFLIGGTSPYTMVFTSPNWSRSMQQNNFHFNRLDGSPLFSTNSPLPLNQRAASFKDMLYSLRMAFQAFLSSQAPSLNYYITTMVSNDVPGPDVATMGGPNGAAVFFEKYAFLKDETGAEVMAGHLPISHQMVVSTVSDYEMIPYSNYYAKYTAQDGSPVTIEQPPLALNENGLPNSRYIGTAQWDKQNCKINEALVRTQQLHERTLPGSMGIQKPFVIWSDFLEDKIIKLPYRLNSDKFVTAFDGDTQYLLPLKRNFFKFFHISDINKKACAETNKKLVEITLSANDVTVCINIPIKDHTHHTIELKRTYRGDDIVPAEFTLGFFPFYKCTNNLPNRYSIMNCGIGARLTFVKETNLEKNISAASTVRTKGTAVFRQTEYTTIKETFDFVEVSVSGTKGIIIPQMSLIGEPLNHYKFGVDFGTSNTYIAHVTTSNPQPETLEIDAHDQQTVLLNKPGEGNLYRLMKPFMDREFAPMALGKEADFSYPARTATCETPTFEAKAPELFGNISIGFNMMREPQAANYFVYKTRLKWLLEEHPGDVHHTNRVKYFFLQTLWMLKNESFLNGGDDTFDVYITFPETMKQPTKLALMTLWNWAKGELQINCEFHSGTQFSESIAPYNCLAHLIQGASFLNVDIGGGTCDLLFVNKENGRIKDAHYSSAMFAGDDLWGDGIRVLAGNGHQENGFVEYITQQIDANANTYAPEILSSLNALRGGVSSSSADVMGYLFKHDQTFQTSDKIRGQRNLYSIVFIHYAAIIYNVARLIKKQGVNIPEKLSFTGMGSKYIDLISTDRAVIRQLTVLLLKLYTGMNVPPTFEIIADRGVDVKEITAKGVLEGLNILPQFQIPSDCLLPINDYGFDTNNSLTYAEVSTEFVKEEALKEFNCFVDLLSNQEFKNFLFSKFNITIAQGLLDNMKLLGRESFTTMSASIPAEYNDLNVTETLFFWPLKNTLVELSKHYSEY